MKKPIEVEILDALTSWERTPKAAILKSKPLRDMKIFGAGYLAAIAALGREAELMTESEAARWLQAENIRPCPMPSQVAHLVNAWVRRAVRKDTNV